MTTESEGTAMADGGRRGAPGQAAELTPPAVLTPEIVADIRRRAERRDRKGWEASVVPVEALYALCDAAASLARERRRVAALQSRIDWTFEALDAYQRGRQGTGEEIADDDIIDVAIALLMDGDDAEADVPVQGGEGEGR